MLSGDAVEAYLADDSAKSGACVARNTRGLGGTLWCALASRATRCVSY
jgi:hypothetical protein